VENSYVFDIYEKMFATPGWKDFVDDIKNKQNNLKDQLLNVIDPTALYRIQGANHVYNYIVELERAMEAAKKAQEQPNE